MSIPNFDVVTERLSQLEIGGWSGQQQNSRGLTQSSA